MTRGLSSKVRAVLSLVSALLLALTAVHAQQNILEKKVKVNFQGVRLSAALQEIEKQARVHFIYSSNIVEPGRKLSYSAENATLSEVFTHLGQEMNLEFKAQNLYIIIKRRAVIPSPPTLTLQTPTENSILKEDVTSPQQMHRTRAVSENTSIDLSAQIHQLYLRKLDSLNLRKAMLEISRQPATDHTTKFYAAAGLYLNDFSGGVELQAGVRSFYAVFNAGLSEGKYLRMGFGAGTNIHLAGKLRVNPVYTFSTIKEISSQGISSINEDGYTVSAQQHQLKLMLEYPFAKNFYARLGPSLNVMNLNFKQQADPAVYYTGRSQPRSYSYPMPQNSPGAGFFTATALQRSNTASPEVRYEAMKSWIGFEAGIYYNLNFSRSR
ncbi:MAG TPA: hypothetical protein VG737_00895 [Cyclobacteriaceae bacterium]|nr:hypothetical protein [Cyclobacteriaceae bacterium]